MARQPHYLTRSVVVALFVVGWHASRGAAHDAVAVSTERLKQIHQALVAYERKHKQWPDHLSDLVPEFLKDKSVLLDPADPGTGDLGSNRAHKDPKFHVSYSYERNANISGGLPSPLGPFPKPDISRTGWGSWRLVNGHQEYFYGDQVPLVRCYLHRPPEEDREPGKDVVLNLTPSGRVYRSGFDWERHPDSAAFLLRTLRRDLTQGPAHVGRHWILFRVYEHIDSADASRHGELMRDLAPALFAVRDELPEGRRAACKIAARLYLKLGQFDQAIQALDACPKYPGAAWDPFVEGQMRATAYHGLKQWDKEIATWEALVQKRPGNRFYMAELSKAYAAAGQAAQAAEWAKRADPGAQLVGKPAPDFSLPLLDGGTLTLAQARKGKKALLVNFWFCGCQPCRLEFPHLQKLYDASKDQGLEILAVNHGDSKDAVAKFIASKYRFPVGLGRGNEAADKLIFQAYHVSSYPTSYLIDSEGKVVWRGVGFGPKSKKELSAALAELGVK
jgi:peroxiredoxin